MIQTNCARYRNRSYGCWILLNVHIADENHFAWVQLNQNVSPKCQQKQPPLFVPGESTACHRSAVLKKTTTNVAVTLGACLWSKVPAGVSMPTLPCSIANTVVQCDCGTVVTGGETTLDVQMSVAAAQGIWMFTFYKNVLLLLILTLQCHF